jgi:hypothetical protein
MKNTFFHRRQDLECFFSTARSIVVTKILDGRKGSCYTDLIEDADGTGYNGDGCDDDDLDDFPDIRDLVAQNSPAAV